MTYSTVLLSMADCEWTQDVDRGILQGSSYSAEVFARTVDFYLLPRGVNQTMARD